MKKKLEEQKPTPLEAWTPEQKEGAISALLALDQILEGVANSDFNPAPGKLPSELISKVCITAAEVCGITSDLLEEDGSDSIAGLAAGLVEGLRELLMDRLKLQETTEPSEGWKKWVN